MTAPAVVDAEPVASAATEPSLAPTAGLFRDVLGLLASCLVVVVAYSPILFLGHTLSTSGGGLAPGTNGHAPFPGQPVLDPSGFQLDHGASTWQFEPWAEVTSRAYADGEIPLWNPYQGAGTPHAANMQSAVFDPLLLAVNLHPTPLTWDLSIIGAFVMGAAAAYLFGRVLGLRVVPAVVTSAAFSLSGWFFLYSNNHWARACVFLPLLFLLVELVLRSRRLWSVFALAVAVAVNIHIGMPEASFFVIGAASVYAAVRLVQERAAMPMRNSFARLGGAAALGLMLSAPALLLFVQYESLSFNSHKPEFQRGAEAADIWGLLHWVVPWFPGAPEPPVDWLGTAATAAALVAISGRTETKRLHAWLFFVPAALILVKMYDLRVLEWIGRLPVVEFVVFPTFAAPVASFAFAVLAGIGVQVLWQRDLRLGRFFTLLALLVPLLIVLAIALSKADRLLSIVAERQTVWGRGALFAFLAVAVVVVSSRLRPRWSAVLLAGLILAELFWLAPFKIYPKRADPYLTPGWMGHARNALDAEGHARVFGLDGKLYPNTAGAHGLQDIRALDALYVERYFRYVRTFVQPDVFDRFTGEEGSRAPLRSNPMFDALAVRIVLAGRDLANVPGLRLVGRDLDTRVYEKTNAYPRAWVVHDLHLVEGEEEAFAFLQARARRSDGAYIVNAFDPRREAVVESGDESDRMLQRASRPCPGAAEERATIERYAGNSVTLAVEAACPGLLVLPDTYFPGWKATVNGEERTIHPTNGAFRGVVVPEGRSQVEFRYEPRAFPLGIGIALAGLGGFAVIWAGSAWRRRREPAPTAP